MIFWVLVGIAIGYFFKPQLDQVVGRVVRMLRDDSKKDRWE
jgi:hypothetical protein